MYTAQAIGFIYARFRTLLESWKVFGCIVFHKILIQEIHGIDFLRPRWGGGFCDVIRNG